VARRQTLPALVAENIAIENSSGIVLRLNHMIAGVAVGS
jgi:hypothetical protein